MQKKIIGISFLLIGVIIFGVSLHQALHDNRFAPFGYTSISGIAIIVMGIILIKTKDSKNKGELE